MVHHARLASHHFLVAFPFADVLDFNIPVFIFSNNFEGEHVSGFEIFGTRKVAGKKTSVTLSFILLFSVLMFVAFWRGALWRCFLRLCHAGVHSSAARWIVVSHLIGCGLVLPNQPA